ncbi:hypothetical protein ACWIGM_15615 [Bosea sp. NPDC055332]
MSHSVEAQPSAMDGGFALLLALALLATLSGSVLLIQSIGFATASDAAIEIRQGSARLVLDAAMRTQIERIFLYETVDPDGVPRTTAAPAGSFSFQLGFEDGKVDVNSAPPELIKLALQAAGTDLGTIEAVLATVAELRRQRAAVADPLQIFPTGARLEARTAKEQARFLTTFSGSRGVNLTVSEREFLDQAAPGSAAALAPGGSTAARTAPGSWQGWLTSTRTTIALTGTYRHNDGWTMRRKAVFRIDRGRQAVQFLAWRTI